MLPPARKILYAVTFEVGGVFVSALSLLVLSTAGPADTLTFGILTAIVAMGWCYVFNTMFEAWEMRQTRRGRSQMRRIAHAILYETTLVLLLLPITMWWFSVSFFGAVAIEISLTLIFLAYTYVFTWAFDRVFGLPTSAL